MKYRILRLMVQYFINILKFFDFIFDFVSINLHAYIYIYISISFFWIFLMKWNLTFFVWRHTIHLFYIYAEILFDCLSLNVTMNKYIFLWIKYFLWYGVITFSFDDLKYYWYHEVIFLRFYGLSPLFRRNL